MKPTISLLACGLALATTSIAALGASTAGATTYIGERTVGTATVDLSVKTDGAVGTLNSSDIEDYTVTLHNAGQSFTLSFDDGGSVSLLGSAVTATPTQLLFDFSDPDEARLKFSNQTDSEYCLGTDLCEGATQAGEFAFGEGVTGIFVSIDTGNQVIASVPGVPEPATWAMMLLGFGGLGIALRSARRTAPATAS